MPTPSQDYAKIPLTSGQFAMVDAADYEWLNQWKWSADWNKHRGTFYAVRTDTTTEPHRKIYMHRLILGLVHGDKQQADHQNLNKLDNRRSNLRLANYSQNATNRATRRDNTKWI